MGRSYRNEIDIWTENCKISADRFFSKRCELETTIDLKHSHGDVTMFNITAMDHFQEMFVGFLNIINNPTNYKTYLQSLKSHQKLYFAVYSTLEEK